MKINPSRNGGITISFTVAGSRIFNVSNMSFIAIRDNYLNLQYNQEIYMYFSRDPVLEYLHMIVIFISTYALKTYIPVQ